MNLESTYFLNGLHPKIVGFIYFNENPLKMTNVPYFIWKALFIIGEQLNKKVKFQNLWRPKLKHKELQ